MAFIDEVVIRAKAGDGGNGVVRWRHEKFVDKGGPAGGNGGRGGDVYFRAISDLSCLERYRAEKKFKAGNGESGQSFSKHGKSGEDIEIIVPVGSVIQNLSTEEVFELTKVGDKVKALSGGMGGLGNEHFKSSTNTTPKQATDGREGEEAKFKIELRLIADIGLIGIPSAGKSSLLNSLTNAKAKVGAYAFTTLEPNLGMMHDVIMADIPGLIEGASQGKGLGHKFLRHISRTKILAHCITCESEDLLSDYKVIRKELKAFDSGLMEKDEVIIVTKSDLIDEKTLKSKIKELKSTKKKIVSVSVLDDESIKSLKKALIDAVNSTS